MQVPPHPPHEQTRLDVLHALQILGSAAEERFDRIVEITKLLFEVPICLITLVDVDRQWFKANCGLGVDSTARSISFCGHAICSDDVMVVEDALADKRFDDNPLVNGPPFIRFYAGAPLIAAGGLRLGTLCVIDSESRKFPAQDRELLRRLSGLARDELLRPPAPAVDELARHVDDKDDGAWLTRILGRLAGFQKGGRAAS